MFKFPYKVSMYLTALAGELDLQWAWSMSALGVYYQSSHWLKAPLEREYLESKLGVNYGFSQAQWLSSPVRLMGHEQETWGSWASPFYAGSLCLGVDSRPKCWRSTYELALHCPQCACEFTQWQWQFPPWLDLRVEPEGLEPHFWCDSDFPCVHAQTQNSNGHVTHWKAVLYREGWSRVQRRPKE